MIKRIHDGAHWIEVDMVWDGRGATPQQELDGLYWEHVGICQRDAHHPTRDAQPRQAGPGRGHTKAKAQAQVDAKAKAELVALADPTSRLHTTIRDLTRCACGRQVLGRRCRTCQKAGRLRKPGVAA